MYVDLVRELSCAETTFFYKMSKILVTFFSLIILSLFSFVALVVWVFFEFGRDLPDYRQLADYQPSVMSRIYAGDGRLVEEYAVEGRVFVPFDAIPSSIVNAFVSSEDKTFYYHPGLDFLGISRAIFTNIVAMCSGHKYYWSLSSIAR